MGLIQNKVTVSQPNSHIIVENAGGLRGLTGDKGDKGDTGPAGQAATVTVGSTSTLPAGSDATVTNVGSTSAAIFNFGIPKGDTGDAGAAATISAGSTTTLAPGSSATVTNSGTSSAAVFDFGIPQGAKGDTGTAATIAAGTTTTLDAGESATVANSGTSSAAVFDFGIPKGADGQDGYSPTATVTKTGDTATITITDKDGTTTASISDGSTPTVNDGTLTIQKNGTTVQTFSADQASNVTANITVPTQFSELSGTVSSSQIEDEAITTGSVSGTGTNITLAGTMEDGGVESVDLYGDTTQHTYTGKNLIGLVDGTYTKNSVTAVVKDGVITFSGTSDATGDMYIPYIKTPLTLAAGTYTHSYSRVPSGTVAMNTGLGYAFNIGWNGSPATATINSETSYGNSYRIQISENINYNGVVIKPQLEVGSATSFEPYVGGTASPNPDYPQEVEVVKGLQTITISDGDSQTQTYQIDLEGKNKFSAVIEQGSIDASTGDITNNKRARSKGFVDVLPSTEYTFNITNNLSSPTLGIAFAYDKNGNYVTQYPSSGWSSMPLTFTTGATIEKIRVVLKTQNEDVVSGSNFSDVQLEIGGSATTYVAYRAIELCKIGTYQDYIYKSGDDWYVRKEIRKVTLDGDEDWDKNVNYNNGFLVKSTDLSFKDTTYFGGFSNQYTIVTNSVTWQGAGKAGFNSSRVFWIQTINTTYTLQTFKDSISANPIIVYCVETTPTDTKITNATLISELDSLLSATTYDNNTYITVSGDLASPLEVVAEADSKLAPNSVYGASIKDGAVSVSKIADLKALADALSPYLS